MKIVIVGNGPAAVTAAETVRGIDQTCEITMIAKEDGPCYSPCPLAEYVEGSVSRDGLHRAEVVQIEASTLRREVSLLGRTPETASADSAGDVMLLQCVDSKYESPARSGSRSARDC